MKKINFIRLIYSYNFIIGTMAFISSISFFLTSSPYAARHSGAAGDFGSDSFAINFVKIFTIFFIVLCSLNFIRFKYIIYYRYYFLWFLTIIISGIYNSWIFEDSVNFLSIFLTYVSIFIWSHRYIYYSKKEFFYKKLLILLCFVLGISFFLALFGPGVYGAIPGFSRHLRGELTLLSVTNLDLIIVPLVLTFYNVSKRFYHNALVCIFICYSLFMIADVSRMFAINIIFILILFFTIFNNLKYRFIALIILVVIMSAFLYFFAKNEILQNSSREDLWLAHLDAFLRNPIFGNGSDVLNKLGYEGRATSDIGILAMLSKSGIFGNMFFFCILVVSLKKSLFFLKYTKNLSDKFFSWLFLWQFPTFLLTGFHSPVGRGFLFFLSLNYIFLSKLPSDVRLRFCRETGSKKKSRNMLNFLDKSMNRRRGHFHKYPFIVRSYENGTTSVQTRRTDRSQLQASLFPTATGIDNRPQAHIPRQPTAADGF